MWSDVDAIDPAELVAPDNADEFPDHEHDHIEPEIPLEGDDVDNVDRDEDAVEAIAGGLDPDAIEDAEDLEGVMELLGMRGPIAGLFQNAIFCAFLVSVTIFLGIFVPYNIGRVTVWTIANPMRPARMLFSLSKFVQDVALIFLGSASTALSYLVYLVSDSFGLRPASHLATTSLDVSWNMTANASLRVAQSFVTEIPIISAGEMRNFSAISHEALLLVKGYISLAFSTIGQLFMSLFDGNYAAKGAEVATWAAHIGNLVWEALKDAPEVLATPGSWVINLSLPENAGSVDPELAYWGSMDRVWAILGGYLALSFVAGLYLRRGTPFSSSQTGQEWEASIIDGLNQASGVMKVILIIGIEMLVFPLYCGLLLDAALLPLFENTTLMSRVMFTVKFPLTSMFVHWFVGTGYMFHFALFVSMCRKIMRKGVLYFIRDPDDPEFHPVRDVLERNVTTQLRKILFSAFVYGALVIVCLGGVVWGLSFILPTVLPIHYSSNEPVLEFPIDMLFYNFLMPMAVKVFKPSDGLHAMYTWWFRKCARGLRITWFLFGERRVDEEGILTLQDSSTHQKLPWWRRVFLEVDEGGQVVPKTFHDAFEGGMAKPTTSVSDEDMASMTLAKADLLRSRQLIPDGRFVRAPASDQVKIPKGRGVFLDVTEFNNRKDGKRDQPETDLYSSNQYQFVYVPPYFRVRVFLFILFIWLFAAVTGVGFTIVPLLFGRRVFKLLVPEHIRTNDIYAFSIGIYLLGSAAYAVFHARAILSSLRSSLAASLASITSSSNGAILVLRRVGSVVLRAAKVVYAYTLLVIVFPTLVSSLVELYLLIPLNTYMYSGLMWHEHEAASNDGTRHTLRLVQTWTLGLLYLKLADRAIASWYPDTRLVAATRAILRRGWLDPDVRILTRAFAIPGTALWLLAVMVPLLAARTVVSYRDMAAPPAWAAVLVYRLSFPVAAAAAVVAAAAWSLVGVFRGWKARIRDEAYLIGERLHNFRVASGPGGRGKGSSAWKVGTARL
jgi:E3 ubiquitin-protein ligase MARCH6